MVGGLNKVSHERTHGCLHLIDLAGSERVAKSGAQGQQVRWGVVAGSRREGGAGRPGGTPLHEALGPA